MRKKCLCHISKNHTHPKKNRSLKPPGFFSPHNARPGPPARLHPRLPLLQAQHLCHRARAQAALEVKAAGDGTGELGGHPDEFRGSKWDLMGFSCDLMGFYWELTGFYWDLMGFCWDFNWIKIGFYWDVNGIFLGFHV